MLNTTKVITGQYPTQNQLILFKTKEVSTEISVICGFDTNIRFKPVMIITHTTLDEGRKEEIKLFLSEWLALSGLKNHFNIQLSAIHMKEHKEESFAIGEIESCIFGFKFDPIIGTTLVIRQLGWEIELDSDDWNGLMKIKDFIDSFFLWSEYARDAIQKFYSEKYIPKCVELNVNYLFPEHFCSILPDDKKNFLRSFML